VDPIQAESVASTLVGPFRSTHPRERDETAAMGVALVSDIAEHPSVDTLALLRAIATLEPLQMADAARAASVRMRATGVEDPTWSMAIGRPELVDAWASTDEFGDQTQLVGNFAYPGLEPHAMVTMVDHNFQGLVRQAMLHPNADRMRETWLEISGMAIRPVTAQELADLWGQGLTMLDLYLDPPIDAEVDGLAPLLRSRLRLLPRPREIETPEVKAGARRSLVAEFRRSSYASGAGSLASLARSLVDFKCDYLDGDPLRWSPTVVEICIVDWFPRKVTLDDVETDALPDILRRWIRFAGERRGLPDEAIAETLEAVKIFERDYLAAMRDPNSAGPAKGLVAAMLAAGIDLADKRAVNAWILAFNAMPIEQRDRILGRS
jgi:hypothetical protein